MDRRSLIAEAIGTFFLTFAICAGIAVDGHLGDLGHVGVSIAAGLVVVVMIYAIGEISGAHINPAVTVAFALARLFPWRRVPAYVAVQMVGALVAGALVLGLFGSGGGLGVTVPQELPGDAGLPTWLRAGLLEVVLSALLMFVILGVSTGAKEIGLMAGVAVGGTVMLCALIGGPVSGASMNPARSLGPALFAGEFAVLPLYLVAPVLGTALSVAVLCVIRPEKCCRGGAC